MAYSIFKNYYAQNIRTLQHLCTDTVISHFQECYDKSKSNPLERDLKMAALTTNENFSNTLQCLQFPVKLITDFVYKPFRCLPRPLLPNETVDVCAIILETLKLHRDLRVCVKSGYTETSAKGTDKVIGYLTNLMYLTKNHFMQNPFVFDEFVSPCVQAQNRAVRTELVHNSIQEAIELSNACTYYASTCSNEAKIVDVLRAELLHGVHGSTKNVEAAQSEEAEKWKHEQETKEMLERQYYENEERYKWRERVIELLQNHHEAAQAQTSHMQEAQEHIGNVHKTIKSMSEKVLIQLKEVNTGSLLQDQNKLISAQHQSLVQGLEQGFSNLTILNRRLYDECKFNGNSSRVCPPQTKPSHGVRATATFSELDRASELSHTQQYESNSSAHAEQLTSHASALHPVFTEQRTMQSAFLTTQKHQSFHPTPPQLQQQTDMEQQQTGMKQQQHISQQPISQQPISQQPISQQHISQQPISQQSQQQELRQLQSHTPIFQSLNNGQHSRVAPQEQSQIQVTQYNLQTAVPSPKSNLQSMSILQTPYEHLPYPSFHKMQHASTMNVAVLDTSRGEVGSNSTPSVEARDVHLASTP
jgi:hypothetical protein